MTQTSAASPWQDALVRWRRARRRFNARALNERRLLVIAVVAVLVLVLDTLWLTPAFKAFKVASARFNSAQSEVQTLQGQQARHQADLQVMKQTIQGELAAMRKRLADNRAAFEQAEQTLVPAREMRELLEELLAEQAPLKLVSMRTLTREVVRLPGNQPKDVAVQLYRHGLEVAVQGRFHDLLNWLLSIEEMPRKVLWDTLNLTSDEHDRLTLTVRLHTLSRDAEPMEMTP